MLGRIRFLPGEGRLDCTPGRMLEIIAKSIVSSVFARLAVNIRQESRADFSDVSL